MERRFWVGQEGHFIVFDQEGKEAGSITGCILSISEKQGDGRYALVDTGIEVRTVRVA